MVRDGVANILHELQKRGFDPRRVGADAWESRCPAHRSTDHDLSITRDESDHVVLECRSAQRCVFERIIRALGLGYDTLYNETPDCLITQLSGIPIQRASCESSQAHEKNDPGLSAIEATDRSAGAALPAGRHADADAVETESIPEVADALLESRLQAAADAAIPPVGALEPRSNECRLSLRERTPFRGAKGDEGATATGDCPAGWDGLTIRPTDPSPEAELSPDRGNPTDECAAESDRAPGYLEPDSLDSFSRPPMPFRASRPTGAACSGEQALDGTEGVPEFDAPLSDDYKRKLERMSPVRLLSRLASRARLLRSADGRFWAQVPVDDRHEIYGLRSAAFRDWLVNGFVIYKPEPPSGFVIRRVVGMLEAWARFDPGIPDVFIRVGRDGDGSRYFLDLGDPSGRAVAIGEKGWQVVDRPRAQFHRPKGLLPLPLPEGGGSIELLRRYVNLTDADFRLMIAWLTAVLRPVGPYPILGLHGEQDSGKSTLVEVLRLLIDPHTCIALNLPGSTLDLMATAVNGWLLAYDNISDIPRWMSDALCQLVYGGAVSGRALYTNDDRSFIHAQRPVLLSGIDEFVRWPDLKDRCVLLQLAPIPDDRRRGHDEFWRAFHADRPRILGAVLDAVAGGLRALPSVHLARLPRMADYTKWGEAVGRGLGWGAETFLAAYNESRKQATEAMLEASPLAEILLHATRCEPSSCAPAAELHARLTRIAGKQIAASAGWPKTTRMFADEMRRIAPQLRLHGLFITFERRRDGRYITLRWEGCTD